MHSECPPASPRPPTRFSSRSVVPLLLPSRCGCVAPLPPKGTYSHALPLLAAEYRLIAKKGEGTFSEVLKAQSIKNGKYFAIKCMKNHFDSIEQVNNLREIQALRRLSPNPGVIKLYEVL